MANNKILASLCAIGLLSSSVIYASNTILLLPTQTNRAALSNEKITSIVKERIDISAYRQVKVQVIYNAKHEPDHLLVYLFRRGYHSFKVARIELDSRFNGIAVTQNYALNADDYSEQPGIKAKNAACPDPSIEFIGFAPNDDDLEQSITKEVVMTAMDHGLKTILLLAQDATRSNYLNYMKCPHLKGNFYDGDANPEEIVTVDGVISYQDIDYVLGNQFNYKVTNIWLACEAYNDPMKTTMLHTAQSQKFAAGINDLMVGPSDQAAACAMEAALNGRRMTSAFQSCYHLLDVDDDHWGFGGRGADIFGR